MTTTRKDIAATIVTGLAVATFFATHERWDVWLVGDSRRWAAGVILVLGFAACTLGNGANTMQADRWSAETKLATTLGIVSLGLGVTALINASLTVLSLLTIAIVALWAVATMDHLWHHTPRHPSVTA
jgi:hypothetical protein